MITVDGAGLIAQVMPVGLLIVTVEQRWLGPARREPGPIGTVWWYVGLPYKAFTILLCLLAIWACIAAVSNDQPLTGFSADLVAVSLGSLGFMVFGTLLGLLTYSHIGRDKAIANVEKQDRQQLIVERAHKVARLRKRDERRRNRADRGRKPPSANAGQ